MTDEEFIIECAKRGVKIDPPKQNDLFSVILSYDRGLGTEYKNLPSVKSNTLAEAQVLANKEGLDFVTALGKEVILKEVKITPNVGI